MPPYPPLPYPPSKLPPPPPFSIISSIFTSTAWFIWTSLNWGSPLPKEEDKGTGGAVLEDARDLRLLGSMLLLLLLLLLEELRMEVVS